MELAEPVDTGTNGPGPANKLWTGAPIGRPLPSMDRADARFLLGVSNLLKLAPTLMGNKGGGGGAVAAAMPLATWRAAPATALAAAPAPYAIGGPATHIKPLIP